jgi:galactose mutarotase-like enzyme
MEVTFMVRLTSGEYKAEVDALGAELKSFKRVGGEEHIWCGDPAAWNGVAPILFPFSGSPKDNRYEYGGKIYEMPQHGFARTLEWRINRISDSTVEFVLRETPETLKLYPFKFELTARYTLRGARLTTLLTVRNTDSKTLYYGAGGHTGFATEGGAGLAECSLVFPKSGDYRVYRLEGRQLKTESVALFNGDTLPLSPALFADDCFVIKNPDFDSALLKRAGHDTIAFSFTGMKAFVVWAARGTNRFVCLEPWSDAPESVGAPPALTEKPQQNALESGKSAEHSFTIEIRHAQSLI